jgi:hypothetical protein
MRERLVALVRRRAGGCGLARAGRLADAGARRAGAGPGVGRRARRGHRQALWRGRPRAACSARGSRRRHRCGRREQERRLVTCARGAEAGHAGGSAWAQQARASARDAGTRQALERRSRRVSVNGAGGAIASSAGGVGACSRVPRGVIWHGRCRQNVTRAKDALGSGLRRSGTGGCCSRTGTRSSSRRRRGQAREGDGRQSGAPPQMEHAR